MLINIENLSFSYGIHKIFQNLSLSIAENDAIGLIGLNGCGKSTFFKLLTEKCQADQGTISKKTDLSLGYLEQEIHVSQETTLDQYFTSVFKTQIDMEKHLRLLEKEIAVNHTNTALLKKYGELQDTFSEIHGYEYPSRIRGIENGLHFSEDDLKKPFNTLSGGEKTRAALGRMLLISPELLLLDEPTNYLDIESLQWLEQFLKSYTGTFIIISHDRYFLDKVCSKILEVNHYNLDLYKGNYSYYAREKEKHLIASDHQYAKQLQEITRQKKLIARFRAYNSVHSSKRAASREKALSKIDPLEKRSVEKTSHFTFKPQIQSGNDVISVKDVSKNINDRLLFQNMTFDIHRSEKIGIIGANGIGKTTLFRILTQETTKDNGSIRLGQKVNIGYFDQESKDLIPFLNHTLLEALWDIDSQQTENDLRNLLAAFLFTGDDVYKKITDLSGGEKARILLARLVLSKANFLLLDEPTNHIDMQTREVLEHTLSAYQGTLLFISHDRYFLNKIATKIYNFTQNGIEETLGNYDDYLQSKTDAAERETLAALEKDHLVTKTQKKAARKKEKAVLTHLREKKKALKKIEENIEMYENLIATYEAEMCKSDFYDDPEQVAKVTSDYQEKKDTIATLTANWEALFLEIENLEENNELN